MAHLPHLANWTVRGLARWVATFLLACFATALVEENYKTYFEEHHLNKIWKWVPAILPDFAVPSDPHWLWFGTGLSLGIAGALWIVNAFPDHRNAPNSIIPLRQRRISSNSIIRYGHLEEAARLAYGKIRGSKLQVAIDNKAENDHDRIICAVGAILLKSVDIYGERPPSSLREPISKEDIEKLQLSCRGSLVLIKKGGHPFDDVVYRALYAEKNQLERAVDNLIEMRDSPILQISEM